MYLLLFTVFTCAQCAHVLFLYHAFNSFEHLCNMSCIMPVTPKQLVQVLFMFYWSAVYFHKPYNMSFGSCDIIRSTYTSIHLATLLCNIIKKRSLRFLFGMYQSRSCPFISHVFITLFSFLRDFFECSCSQLCIYVVKMKYLVFRYVELWVLNVSLSRSKGTSRV